MMNYIKILEYDFIKRVSTTLLTASNAIKKGEDTKQVVELFEQIARARYDESNAWDRFGKWRSDSVTFNFYS